MTVITNPGTTTCCASRYLLRHSTVAPVNRVGVMCHRYLHQARQRAHQAAKYCISWCSLTIHTGRVQDLASCTQAVSAGVSFSATHELCIKRVSQQHMTLLMYVLQLAASQLPVATLLKVERVTSVLLLQLFPAESHFTHLAAPFAIAGSWPSASISCSELAQSSRMGTHVSHVMRRALCNTNPKLL